MTDVLADRAWSTWDGRFPACVMHIPSRFAVRVTLFSATANRYDPLDSEDQAAFRLGEHTTDGDYVALRVHSAGTTLAIELAKGDWSGVSGRVRIVETTEMMFRLAVLVEAGFLAPPGDGAGDGVRDRDRDGAMVDGRTRELSLVAAPGAPQLMPAAARARWRSQHFHLIVSPVPALGARYVRPGDVADDLQQRGWLYHPPPAPDGDWVAFRQYGNPREPIAFAVAQGTDAERAAGAARARLASVDATIETAGAAARAGDDATCAIRDVMAWNTVWDDANHRPYTCLSRAWLRGFGGWGIWMSDAFYNAMLCARAGDTFMARANLQAVLASQQAAGNLPCLVAADEEWVDRTQLPVACFAVWRTYLLTGDRAMLAEVYPTLLRHHAWVRSARDGNANGLYEYGSSPTGNAQGASTKQGALNESGMDNLAVFDEAVFNRELGVLEFEEPGHNSLLALESEMLGRIARELGRETEADALQRDASALAARISAELWDPEREVFAGRHWDGRFAAHISPTSFFPLVAGAATAAQAEAMVHRHLLDEHEFWGTLPLPSAPFSDPVGRDDSYWRGRIWPPHLFFCWEGLRRAGQDGVAAQLTARAWAMFDAEWSTKRHSHENFNSRDAGRHEAHDSDPFYSWGALIPFMAAAERADASPWSGITLGDGTGAPAALSLPGRRYAIATEADRMMISLDGRDLLALTPPRRIARLGVSDERIDFTIDGAPCRLELAAPWARRLQALSAGGAPAKAGSDPEGVYAVNGEVVARFAPARRNESEQRPTTTEEQTP